MPVNNKQGKRFSHMVGVAKDPNTEPTYSYKFPVLRGLKVTELWAQKVRPIKSLTYYLQGLRLKRYTDYMVHYDQARQQYEYWFKSKRITQQFAAHLFIANIKHQPLKNKGYRFNIECPNCSTHISREDIKWTA